MLAKLNKVFGNLLFMSDNIGDYNEDQMNVFKDTLDGAKKQVISSEYKTAELIEIKYIENEKEYELTFNINTGEIVSGSID